VASFPDATIADSMGYLSDLLQALPSSLLCKHWVHVVAIVRQRLARLANSHEVGGGSSAGAGASSGGGGGGGGSGSHISSGRNDGSSPSVLWAPMLQTNLTLALSRQGPAVCGRPSLFVFVRAHM
jgi:hypothetical protein